MRSGEWGHWSLLKCDWCAQPWSCSLPETNIFRLRCQNNRKAPLLFSSTLVTRNHYGSTCANAAVKQQDRRLQRARLLGNNTVSHPMCWKGSAKTWMGSLWNDHHHHHDNQQLGHPRFHVKAQGRLRLDRKQGGSIGVRHQTIGHCIVPQRRLVFALGDHDVGHEPFNGMIDMEACIDALFGLSHALDPAVVNQREWRPCEVWITLSRIWELNRKKTNSVKQLQFSNMLPPTNSNS